MGARYDIDWVAIERDYRIGQLTIREIGRQHKVAPSSITRRARKHRWTRDLSAEVRVRTRAALIAVATPKATLDATESNTDSRAYAETGVDAAVMTNVAVVRSHQSRCTKLGASVDRLQTRLDDTLAHHAEIVAEIEKAPAETRAERSAKHRALAAVRLEALVGIAQALAGTLAKLMPLERRAFNIDDERAPDDTDPLERLRRELSGTAIRPREDDTVQER
jgi:hypothetical protein